MIKTGRAIKMMKKVKMKMNRESWMKVEEKQNRKTEPAKKY